MRRAGTRARPRAHRHARRRVHPARSAGVRELLPELPQRPVHALQPLDRRSGLTEQQIRDNLMFGEGKLGDTMTVAMRKSDAKQWFGVAPPDLSVVARSRGADWLYTYLRSYYRDDKHRYGLEQPGVSERGDAPRAVGAAGPAGARGEGASKVRTASTRSARWFWAQPGTLSPRRIRQAGGRPGELPRIHGRARTRRPRAARLSACSSRSACCSSCSTCSRRSTGRTFTRQAVRAISLL